MIKKVRHNPVHKHSETFNRPATHMDRKKEMKKGSRKDKSYKEDL